MSEIITLRFASPGTPPREAPAEFSSISEAIAWAREIGGPWLVLRDDRTLTRVGPEVEYEDENSADDWCGFVNRESVWKTSNLARYGKLSRPR